MFEIIRYVLGLLLLLITLTGFIFWPFFRGWAVIFTYDGENKDGRLFAISLMLSIGVIGTFYLAKELI